MAIAARGLLKKLSPAWKRGAVVALGRATQTKFIDELSATRRRARDIGRKIRTRRFESRSRGARAVACASSVVNYASGSCNTRHAVSYPPPFILLLFFPITLNAIPIPNLWKLFFGDFVLRWIETKEGFMLLLLLLLLFLVLQIIGCKRWKRYRG